MQVFRALRLPDDRPQVVYGSSRNQGKSPAEVTCAPEAGSVKDIAKADVIGIENRTGPFGTGMLEGHLIARRGATDPEHAGEKRAQDDTRTR